MALLEPQSFDLLDLTKGIDISKPPVSIDPASGQEMLNVRFRKGQLTQRVGTQRKYAMAPVAIVTAGIVYPIDNLFTVLSGSTKVICALSWNRFYYVAAGGITPAQVCGDGSAGFVGTDYSLVLDPKTDWISVDEGVGSYDFAVANGGAELAEGGLVVVATNQATASTSSSTGGGLMVGGYLDGAQLEVVNFGVASTDCRYGAPMHANAVAIFDWRIVAGGVDDSHTKIQWTGSNGLWDGWNELTVRGVGAGEQFVGDSLDPIMSMKKLGEYLMVYKKQSIWLGRKTGITDQPLIFTPMPSAGIGCIAPNSVAEVGGQSHLFLGQDSVYRMTLSGLEDVAANVKEFIFKRGESPITPEYAVRVKGAYIRQFNEYWLCVPTGRFPEVQNFFSNPLMVGAVSAAAFPFGWSNGGAVTASTVATGGLFANSFLRWTGTDSCVINPTTYTPGGSIAGKKYSIVAWVKNSGVGLNLLDVTMSFKNAGGAEVNKATRRIALTTAFAPVVLSGTAGAAVVSIVTTFTAVTAAPNTDIVVLDIAGAYMCCIDSLDNLYGEPGVDVDGAVQQFQAPGFVTPWEIQLIPMVAYRIGPWMCDTMWVLSIDSGAWTKWILPMTAIGEDSVTGIVTIADLSGTVAQQNWRFDDEVSGPSAVSSLLAGHDGNIRELSEGAAEDYAASVMSTAVFESWHSKAFDFSKPMIDKTLSRLTIYHERSHPPVSVLVEASCDGGVTWYQNTVAIVTGTTRTYADFFISGPTIEFKVTSTTGRLTVSGFSVKLIARGDTNDFAS